MRYCSLLKLPLFKKFIGFTVLIVLGIKSQSQVFPVDTLLRNGERSNRINLVYLSDGYQSAELPTFITNAATINDALFLTTPFKEYKNYFNCYVVQVPSGESGAIHPATAFDESTSGGQPALNPNNYFQSTFDYFSIHRLLVAQNTTRVYSVLASNLPDYDQAFVVVNSPYYGGSGGGISTASTDPYSAEVAIHEIGHSFAGLADEYWAGSFYAAERPNLTRNNNPLTIRWKNWLSLNGVGIYPHAEDPAWFRPHQTCKMRYLGYPFCSVCTEKFIDRIHQLVNMIDTHTPVANSFTLTNTNDVALSIKTVQTIPSTLSINWYLNNSATPFATNQENVTIPFATFNKGNNTIKVEVTDNTSLSKSSLTGVKYVNYFTWMITKPIVSPKVQKAPVVDLTGPANNAIYTANAKIILQAVASDSDGTVSYVNFYNNGTLLKTDSASPFNYTITNVAVGSYSFSAKATDNDGLTGNSATVAVSVIVPPNKAPLVSITSPVNNSAYAAPASIIINAAANDPDGTITSVKFYNGSTLLSTDSTLPYSYTLNNAAAGIYKFYAQATDDSGVKSSSSTISTVVVAAAFNKAPVVSITSPRNNANYPAIATIVLKATASDTDGTVTHVKFYQGSVLLKTDSTRPFSCSIYHPPPGNYSFAAKATDNKGLTNNSATVTVGVSGIVNKAPAVVFTLPANNAMFIALASITLNAIASDADGTVTSVQFFNGSTLIKTDSIAPFSYTVNEITAGRYRFYAKAIDNNGLANSSSTVSVFVSPGISNKAPGVKLIHPANNAIHYAPGTIYMNASASDTDGIIANVKFYLGSTLLSVDSIPPYIYTVTNLPVGNYSFAAKATDNKGLESNAATAAVPVLVRPDKAPLINLTTPANNTIYPSPATITLNATASDADGAISDVKFFNGSILLKTDTTIPYTYTSNNVAAGTYKFYAKATDNKGLANSTAIVHVVVTAQTNNMPSAAPLVPVSRLSKEYSRPYSIDERNVMLAPNPARSIININTTGLQKHKKLTISILSASGVVLKTIHKRTALQTIPLNVSSFSSGMYIIKIMSTDKVIYMQFIKL